VTDFADLFAEWDATPHTATIRPAYRLGYTIRYERGPMQEEPEPWRPTRRWADRAARVGVRRRNRWREGKLRAERKGWGIR